MAELLELECPGCTGLLELDAGFAGGVCRCSECGTLMTVPAEPGTQQAERLSRPDSPGGRPDTPAPRSAPETVPETTAGGTPETTAGGARPDQPEDTSGGGETSGGGGAGMETYVTDTGRVVHVEQNTVIPTASKKRAVIRATTAVIFFAVVFVLLGLMGLAIFLMAKPEPPAKPTYSDEALQNFPFNRYVNPWTMDAPNVLGMSLGPSAAVVIDASGQSSDWLADVKSAVAAGLTRADSGAQVALFYAADDEAHTLDGGLQAIGELNESRLTRFQQDFSPEGQPPVRKAIEAAIGFEPEAVILVIGRRLGSTELNRIRGLLMGNQVLLDVIAVGRDDANLENLARNTGGRYQFIAPSTLEDWRADADATE